MEKDGYTLGFRMKKVVVVFNNLLTKTPPVFSNIYFEATMPGFLGGSVTFLFEATGAGGGQLE